MADEVGLARWQFERAEAAGMLPKPGHARGWLPDQLDAVRQVVPAIVEPSNLSTLAEAGRFAVADVFEKKGRCYDLYAPADIDALTPERVRPVIEERVAWLDRSLSLDEATESLGWHYRELNQVISDRGIEVRLRRIARADVDALAGDWRGSVCQRPGGSGRSAQGEFRSQDSFASGAKAGSFSRLLRTASAPYSNICRS
ncbi:hypothetical protein ACQPYK_48935 (plasmid) [Streptosporangium sp. CA-135522]|uniref:hypothetical protein n=1 Tax=Streptosporangium sp. CA-135522 TaxID=3240072 RepID=UPI003D8A2741